MIYLNPAGLFPFTPEVQEEVSRTVETFSRLLYTDSGIQHYRETLRQSRRTIARWLSLHHEEQLAFMPNATTACSLILSRMQWKPGDIILTTTHENSTILQEIKELEKHGIEIIPLDADTPDQLLTLCETTMQKRSVRAMLVSHVSHLDGRIFPLDSFQDLARTYQTKLIVDGAQAVGHIPVSFQNIHSHAYFFPGHKWCGGPMGTGALILGEEWENNPSRKEGKEDGDLPQNASLNRFELGTQNIGLIAGFAKACQINAYKLSDNYIPEQIRDNVKTCLGQFSGIKILEWDGPHAPGILSFACLEEKAEQLMRTLSFNYSLAWKTFNHPSFSTYSSIRLSWTSATPTTELLSALKHLE